MSFPNFSHSDLSPQIKDLLALDETIHQTMSNAIVPDTARDTIITKLNEIFAQPMTASTAALLTRALMDIEDKN